MQIDVVLGQKAIVSQVSRFSGSVVFNDKIALLDGNEIIQISSKDLNGVGTQLIA